MSTLETFLLADFLGTATWLWLSFLAVVIALLAFDLGVLHRDEREIGVKESLMLSAGYISMGLLFSVWVFFQKGGDASMDYLTGFLIEKSLSMDNVFVIALIFSFLAIPRRYQHRVLFWGILGVIVLRAIMIGLGAALISEFDWILYVFGAFLLLTGVKMLFSKVDWGKPRRIQGCFVSDDEINEIVEFVKSQSEPDYHEEILSAVAPASMSMAGGGGIVRTGVHVSLHCQNTNAVQAFQFFLGSVQLLCVPSGDDQIGTFFGIGGGDSISNRTAASVT